MRMYQVMIKVLEYNKHITLPDADYTFESCDMLPDLYRLLTPKFEGAWSIVLLDIKISEAKDILSSNNTPEHIDLYIYLSKKKLNQVLLEFPNYKEKELTFYDTYKSLIGQLKHPLDKRAMSYVYNAVGHNIDDLRIALQQLDVKCSGETITLTDVQKEFNYTKRVYTTQVLLDFLVRNKYRYNHYETWLNELGIEYAYYSMYKQVTLLLKDKNKYLHNEDTKNYTASKADAVSISILYVLFVNSTSPYQLDSIMLQFDQMTTERFHTTIDNYFSEVS